MTATPAAAPAPAITDTAIPVMNVAASAIVRRPAMSAGAAMKKKSTEPIPVMDYGQFRRARKLVHECCNYDILRIAGETDINFKKDRSNQKYAYYKKLIKSSEFSNEDSGRRKGVFYCFETGLLHILFCIGIIRIAM